MLQIKQGDIFYADLNPVIGHEQSGLRPVLVLQSNVLNKHLNTVIIAPLTKNLQSKGFFTTYFLPKKSGLKFESMVLLFQIRTIDIKRLKKKIHSLPARNLAEIKARMSLLF